MNLRVLGLIVLASVPALIAPAEATSMPAPAGMPDPTFGNSIAGLTNVPAHANTNLQRMAALPNGDFLVAGGVPGALVLWRFDPDGLPLRSFGRRGAATMTVPGQGDGPPLAFGNDLAILDDGDVVVGGVTQANVNGVEQAHFALARFQPDGSPDPAFGDDGLVIDRLASGVTYGDHNEINRVLRAPGGGVYASATAFIRTNVERGILIRYDDAGRRMTSWGTRGDGGTVLPAPAGKRFRPLVLEQQRDGKLLVTGEWRDRRYELTAWVVFRLHADGRLDRSFGRSGRVVVNRAGFIFTPTALLPRADGSIVVSGLHAADSRSDPGTLVVMRLTSRGAVDRSFGRRGAFRLPHGTPGWEWIEPRDMVEQPGGRILIVSSWAPRSGQVGPMLVRLTATGRADRGFGRNGVHRYAPRVLGEFTSIAVDPRGDVALVGQTPANSLRVLKVCGTHRGLRRIPVLGALGLGTIERGSCYADVLHGGDGDDRLDGRLGADRLYGDAGGDTLLGGWGEASDRLYGGAGDDVLDGGAGDDLLFGGPGRDVLRGGTGDDRLRGGAGADRIHGGGGIDHIDAHDGEPGDRIWCGTGVDHVIADIGDHVAADCADTARSVTWMSPQRA